MSGAIIQHIRVDYHQVPGIPITAEVAFHHVRELPDQTYYVAYRNDLTRRYEGSTAIGDIHYRLDEALLDMCRKIDVMRWERIRYLNRYKTAVEDLRSLRRID